MQECSTEYNFSLVDGIYDWCILLQGKVDRKKLKIREQNGMRVSYQIDMNTFSAAKDFRFQDYCHVYKLMRQYSSYQNDDSFE